MKNSKITAAAALTLLFAAGAHADVDNYVSDIPTASILSGSEANAQAVTVAQGADIYRNSALLRNIQPAYVCLADREIVKVGAVAAARAPYQTCSIRPS